MGKVKFEIRSVFAIDSNVCIPAKEVLDVSVVFEERTEAAILEDKSPARVARNFEEEKAAK